MGVAGLGEPSERTVESTRWFDPDHRFLCQRAAGYLREVDVPDPDHRFLCQGVERTRCSNLTKAFFARELPCGNCLAQVEPGPRGGAASDTFR